MNFQADVWLRGTDFATTKVISGIGCEPLGWTEVDVSAVLTKMLVALDEVRNPATADERQVFLRGFSWIVNPFEDGGVVIAIEMQIGAVVAGPFDIDKTQLEGMISRVMASGGHGAVIH